MIKVPEVWRILELFRIYKCLDVYRSSYTNELKKIENELIKTYKKILKKDLLPYELPFEDLKEIYKIFDDAGIEKRLFPYLGPASFYLKASLFVRQYKILDIKDIEEVFVSKENFKGKKMYGSIKSKSYGWSAWCLVDLKKKDQKNIFTYVVSFNQFREETAYKEIFEKKFKYNEEKLQRSLKKFFISDRFWFHDDLEKYYQNLPYMSLND